MNTYLFNLKLYVLLYIILKLKKCRLKRIYISLYFVLYKIFITNIAKLIEHPKYVYMNEILIGKVINLVISLCIFKFLF